MNKKIWITKDRFEEEYAGIYVWDRKPKWSGEEYYLDGNQAEDDSVEVRDSCNEFRDILEFLGKSEIKQGEMLELNISITETFGRSVTERVSELLKKAKSRNSVSKKELIAFLEELKDA